MGFQDPSSPLAGAPPMGGLVPQVRDRQGGAEGHALAVRRMFDRISPTYDLLNRLLSFGTDRAWRRRALDLVEAHAPPGVLFDCCAGTLDKPSLDSY